MRLQPGIQKVVGLTTVCTTAMIRRMTTERKREEQVKDRKKWEQEVEQQYSRIITTASNVLETKRHIKMVYAEIEESLAHIQEALQERPEAGAAGYQGEKESLEPGRRRHFFGPHGKGRGKD